MRSLTANPVCSITDVIANDNLINASVGWQDDLIILSLEEFPDYRVVQPGWASFAKNWADDANTFTIHHTIKSEVRRLHLPQTHENYRFAQPLPSGEWLLVRSRASGESDNNAHVYSSTGELLRSFHAGDAIEDVQTTEHGQIWISYFDEAAALGFGIGGKGLASFNSDGTLVFGFDDLVQEYNLPRIDDCYAMNVSSSDEVWICYYMDFPLVKIRNRELDYIWKDFPVGGASAFAVAPNRALFAGFYKYPESLFLVDLNTLVTEEHNCTSAAGEPITCTSVFGRGSWLYLRTDKEIFRIDLRSL